MQARRKGGLLIAICKAEASADPLVTAALPWICPVCLAKVRAIGKEESWNKSTFECAIFDRENPPQGSLSPWDPSRPRGGTNQLEFQAGLAGAPRAFLPSDVILADSREERVAVSGQHNARLFRISEGARGLLRKRVVSSPAVFLSRAPFKRMYEAGKHDCTPWTWLVLRNARKNCTTCLFRLDHIREYSRLATFGFSLAASSAIPLPSSPATRRKT